MSLKNYILTGRKKMTQAIKGNVHYGRALIDQSMHFKTSHKVIWEYVANSLEYIDESTEKAEVKVTTSNNSRTIVIEDNGTGMSRKMLAENFFTLFGENILRKKGKIARGKYGTGKAACFGIAEDLEIVTIHNGLINQVSLNRSEAYKTENNFPVKDIKVDIPTDKKNGTKIILKNIFKKIKINEKKVIEFINNEISFENKFQSHNVIVNFTECKPIPIPFKDEFIHYPNTDELKNRFGNAKMYIRIAESSLDVDFRGIKVTTNGFYRAKSLGQLDVKDQVEYIFGEVDLPMLDDDTLKRPAFKSDRSYQLDLDSEDGLLLNNWIGGCVEIERKKLVKAKEEKRQSEEAKKLEKVASKIADILNKHLKSEVEQIKPTLSKNPGTIDNIQNTGLGSGAISELILDKDGKIKASETDETDHGRGDGPGPGPGPNPNELGKKLKEDEAGNINASIKENTKKPRRKGGFTVDFVNHGENELRARYKNDTRTIEINLDHPLLMKVYQHANNDRKNPNFIKMAYEVAIQEYVIAVTQQKSAIGLIDDDVDSAASEMQKMTDDLSRVMSGVYDSL